MKKIILLVYILIIFFAGLVLVKLKISNVGIDNKLTQNYLGNNTFDRNQRITIDDFENCIRASSIEDYYDKTVGKEEFKELFSFLENPVLIPNTLTPNLENVKIYLIPVGVGGEDVLAKSVIVYQDNYCEGTANNLSKLFAPLTKENVIDFYLLKQKIGHSDYSRSGNYLIRSPEDYKSFF